MINYLLVLLVYISFIALIFALKINKKATKKTKTLTIVIPIVSLAVQVIIEFVFYMFLYIFGDNNNIYLTGTMIINAIEILFPFLTVYIVGLKNGGEKKIGIISAIAVLFVILSFIMKYIYIDANIKLAEKIKSIDELTMLDAIAETDRLDDFYKIIIALNIVPAVLLEVFLLVKFAEKNKRRK